MGNPSITLGESTRVFRMSASRAPGCIVGQSMNGYANEHGAVLMFGCHLVRLNDPELVRELAANLELVAQRMESENDGTETR